ncbi:hypothetical protein GE061_006670 [Apolygus lucorum]|uniref:Uncharacterized protein n=1 Tax=Apolygus lucorum TaxID=248454 RepID=A0A6A4IRV7_APOLU|nr:hypothetical protein GE061_006670 [Apolygus lucorum]
MSGISTAQPTMKTNGFNIYKALKHNAGKSPVGIQKDLKNEGLVMTLNDVRRCLAKAANAGLMKRTKKGYRLEYPICDNLIKSSFPGFLGNELVLEDLMRNRTWILCGPDSSCKEHSIKNENLQEGRLKRGASFLSVIGSGLIRSLSFLSMGKKIHGGSLDVNGASLTHLMSEQDRLEDTQPPIKRPCIDPTIRESENHKLMEECWDGMTTLLRKIEKTELLPGVDID